MLNLFITAFLIKNDGKLQPQALKRINSNNIITIDNSIQFLTLFISRVAVESYRTLLE